MKGAAPERKRKNWFTVTGVFAVLGGIRGLSLDCLH